MKNLLPIIYSSKDKIIILWCNNVNFKKYDSRWMQGGPKTGSNITGQMDCDICEKQEEFESLQDAHAAIEQYYKSL